MGAAQSQTICPGRGCSVAHPASKATITPSRAGSLNIMTGVLGGVERADAGIGTAYGVVSFSRPASLSESDPKGGEERQPQRAVESCAPAQAREQGMSKADHGVRPVR